MKHNPEDFIQLELTLENGNTGNTWVLKKYEADFDGERVLMEREWTDEEIQVEIINKMPQLDIKFWKRV